MNNGDMNNLNNLVPEEYAEHWQETPPSGAPVVSSTISFVSLSFCDYVMGPPSTFSWWAAYIGMNE